jgi:4-hydroxyphenylpyruvate dioxygenase-like putative hemolysin
MPVTPPTDAQYEESLDWLRQTERIFRAGTNTRESHMEKLKACSTFLQGGADRVSELFGRVGWWNGAIGSENTAAFESYAQHATQFVSLMTSVSSCISQYLQTHGPSPQEIAAHPELGAILNAIPKAAERLCSMVRQNIDRARTCAQSLQYLDNAPHAQG